MCAWSTPCRARRPERSRNTSCACNTGSIDAALACGVATQGDHDAAQTRKRCGRTGGGAGGKAGSGASGRARGKARRRARRRARTPRRRQGHANGGRRGAIDVAAGRAPGRAARLCGTGASRRHPPARGAAGLHGAGRMRLRR
ncbi:hypothetical protein FX016_17575 [Cupriavidus gilardii]|uniref:Uncharacterized protein n=1 Tax=Cupriavidus cauae TaxID=2608999 RepID=A0A5M8A6U2_9BURK|nr:hypothetical protein FX016_17575 [Cupriavidus gilardii]KAA6117805.1 hypothetical protein F1599_22680 [Cupriavidus cauae]